MVNKKNKKKYKSLWSGRFTRSNSEIMQTINSSISFDKRLYMKDIEASIAHCKMLAMKNIITKTEGKKIIEGLLAIEKEIKTNKMVFKDELEDIHTHIEIRLIELIGSTAKKLHTARSRNDQVATDTRLWVREEIDNCDKLLSNLQQVLLDKAEKHYADIMPGFTHLQCAQPITLGHHLLAYVEMLGRDRTRFKDTRVRLNESPLGAAAIAGTTFNINRDFTASELGFSKPMSNSIDSVSDRDFIIETLSVCNITSIHLSRLAEELVLWSSAGFNFIQLPDSFSTGSSIMPQKRNPDAAELVRGKAGRILGNLVSLSSVLKGLPLAYSKDMQEDKEPLFDSIDNLQISLEVMTGMVNDINFNIKEMHAMADKGYSTATDLADWLVRELKIPFRDAHNITGKIVALAEKSKRKLSNLSLKEMQAIEKRINKEVFNILDIRSSVNAKKSFGGTSPLNVMQSIKLYKNKWL